MVCPKAERKKAISPTPPLQPGVGASSQYLFYKFGQNSTTITNSGSGGDTYNGTATRAQYATDSVGYPIWGPLDANTDGIRVAGGIDNPYEHTWQAGLNIHQWWPGAGCTDYQNGNDGKFMAAGGNQYYAYFHGLSDGCLTGVSTIGYNFTIEGTMDLDCELWVGTGDSAPVNQGAPYVGTGDAPRTYYVWENWYPQLNTNYYLQLSVSGSGTALDTSKYAIGNCIDAGLPPCADDAVTGFPCGCYIYVWREDNVALDLSSGGNWADDVVLWKGGGPGPGPSPGPTPTPGTAPNVNMCVNVREYQPGQE
jgi:hypothetical protein